MKKTEPEINDVVIIKDHNLPPAKWLLGRVVEKHVDNIDSYITSVIGKEQFTHVTLKTKNGYCKRPCNKLYFLPKSVD